MLSNAYFTDDVCLTERERERERARMIESNDENLKTTAVKAKERLHARHTYALIRIASQQPNHHLICSQTRGEEDVEEKSLSKTKK
jgi:hypothetical protein